MPLLNYRLCRIFLKRSLVASSDNNPRSSDHNLSQTHFERIGSLKMIFLILNIVYIFIYDLR